MDGEILYSTISELALLLKTRKVSSLELTKACLERLETLGPRYNALATLTPEIAKRAAKDADDLFKHDRVKSALQGIPYGAKDLLAVKGHPTTWGAAPYRGQVFDYDATVIQKLQGAGAVLAAKLAMVELAGGGGYRYPSASLFGPARNPWNAGHWAGGSSSGSGAAVAAAMTPFAIGSETWGSILSPSSYCGVTGLRPTYGLVSRHGAMALSWTMDKLGPLCRSADDCGLVLQAISGGDFQDPGSSGKKFRYLADYGRPLTDLRLGYAPIDFNERADEGSRPVLQEALKVFRNLGPRPIEISLPRMPYADVATTVIQAEGSTVFEKLILSERFDELPDERQKAGLRAGLEMPAKDYINAMRIRRLIQEKVREVFEKVDLILSFSTAGPAPAIDQALDRRPGGFSSGLRPPEDEERGNADIGAAGNLAGLPAISLPCGFSANGLPVGVQLVGRPFDELTLVTVAREFQKHTDWHRKRPPVEEG